MLIEKCVKRRTALPILPCDCDQCVWFIHDTTYNDCFWVLSEFLNACPGMRFSIEEIAVLENISIKEVVTLLDGALKKLREHVPDFLGDETNSQVFG